MAGGPTGSGQKWQPQAGPLEGAALDGKEAGPTKPLSRGSRAVRCEWVRGGPANAVLFGESSALGSEELLGGKAG